MQRTHLRKCKLSQRSCAGVYDLVNLATYLMLPNKATHPDVGIARPNPFHTWRLLSVKAPNVKKGRRVEAELKNGRWALFDYT